MSVEDSWVFDSLICFLHGPVWNAPLQTFIEEKSLIFDPNLQPDDNDPEIQHIHEEYKSLVDYMLGSFMEEMQITPEQFELACVEGRNQQEDNPFHFHQGLFQQIWAANDIKIFIRMMTQRNVELQLQALDLIEKNQLALLQETELVDNTSPTNSGPGITSSNEKYSDVEDLIAKTVEKELATPEATVTPENENSESDIADKFERLNLFFEKNEQVSPDDVISRQEYLRQQRDKIIEIKKKTRTKQLLETMSRNNSVGDDSPEGASAAALGQRPSRRPPSAQAAQQLLQNGGKANQLLINSDETEVPSALQLRKTLAKRLRSEVVEKQ